MRTFQCSLVKFLMIALNVKRGRTYAFTALWESATLETSDAAEIAGRPLW